LGVQTTLDVVGEIVQPSSSSTNPPIEAASEIELAKEFGVVSVSDSRSTVAESFESFNRLSVDKILSRFRIVVVVGGDSLAG